MLKNTWSSRGIENERLSSVGYGPDRPLHTGKNQEERIKNRSCRVETKQPINKELRQAVYKTLQMQVAGFLFIIKYMNGNR